jgi:hypothetical protein
MKPGAKPGVKKSAKHKAAISKAQHDKSNSNYKHGKRIEYRLRVGLKPNDGKLVEHIDGNRKNNKKSNLRVINDPPKSGTKKAGRNNTSLHSKLTHAKRKKK